MHSARCFHQTLQQRCHLSTSAVLTSNISSPSCFQRIKCLFSNDPPRPTLENNYDIQKRLGSGRFGVVYKGICRKNGTEVAIKNIPKRAQCAFNSASQEVNILRSLGDVAAAGSSSHIDKNTSPFTNCRGGSSILNILETYEDSEDLYIVSDLYTGGELFDHIVNMGDDTFHERDAAKIMKQLLSAVQYLHQQNISHRDLKPENVVFRNESPDSDIVLIDFGMAKKFDGTQMFTEQTGTSLYVAPEVLKGDGYDERADVWSLGVLMYIILTGEPPFTGNTFQEIEDNVIAGNFNIVGGIWNFISPSGKDLVSKLMCVNPSERITITECMDHSWWEDVETEATSAPLPQFMLKSLRELAQEGKLRRKVVQMLAEDLFIDFQPHTSKLRKKDIRRELSRQAGIYGGTTTQFPTNHSIQQNKSKDLKRLKAAYELIYNKIDKSCDGSVSASDMGRLLKRYGVVTSVDELNALTSLMDSDRNGEVTFDEFFAAAASREIVELAVATEEDKLMSAFIHFDRNNSGTIDVSDLHSMFGGNMNDAAQLIQEYDINGDGAICYDEFCTMMRMGV